MTDWENVRQLMTCRLNCPILNFPSNFWSEVSHRFILMCKIWMMPSIALNANSPTLLGHTENESPPVFRVKICICKHKQALILLQLYIRFQVVEDLSSMELFYFCIWSNSSLNYLLFFEYGEALFKAISLIIFFIFWFDSHCAHSTEEDFKDWLHVINQHFLKVFFLLGKFWIILLLPHFVNDALIDIPVSHMRQKMLKIKI